MTGGSVNGVPECRVTIATGAYVHAGVGLSGTTYPLSAGVGYRAGLETGNRENP